MNKGDDKYKKKNITSPLCEVDEDSTGAGSDDSGKGGAAGAIEFHDFLGNNELVRDDLLTAQDKKRLLAVHNSGHEALVQKQKATREQRKALKDGKIKLENYRQTLAGTSQYRNHPILANKAQFSGIDRQVNILPTENVAETNLEKREELKYQYNLTHKPENVPRFNPRPQHR
jgi:hypothetical protein